MLIRSVVHMRTLEFNRVLTDSGYIVKVIPGNKHLMEFRNIAKEHLKNQEYSNVFGPGGNRQLGAS